MFFAFIKEISAALCWARAARTHIAATQGRPRAGLDIRFCP